MERETKEKKQLALRRVPPGDRWAIVPDKTDVPPSHDKIFESLTDALESWYQVYGDTKFYIDARAGEVFVLTIEEVEKKRFSLYGEE